MNKVFLLMMLAGSLSAQQGGFISGEVRDRSGDPIPDASVRVQNEETGARQARETDASGNYASTELAEGTYKITVRRSGFRTLTQDAIAVSKGKSTRVDFVIDILPLQQEVSVSATESDTDPTASGLTVSRSAPAGSLPQNGRDLHALFSIMPGATVTPASLSEGGQFTVGGQRPNANSFSIDGVSGNMGIGIASVPGAILGGNLPGMTTIGGMQSLASKEETERVELRSADFSAEAGDRPGAQIAIETRAGSNDFHGSAFGYLRPHILDSEDWFAHSAAVDLPSAALSGFGGSLGGPLWRNHTFFFASFEKTGVKDDALEVIAVPSLAVRQLITSGYQTVLDAFPLPAGAPLNANESMGYAPLEKNASVTNRSIRLDQDLGSHLQFFARYSSVPSSSLSSDLGSDDSQFRWLSATAGINLSWGEFIQELRFNYSGVIAFSQPGLATNAALNALSQTAVGFNLATRLSIEGVGQTIAEKSALDQERQMAGSYSAAGHWGRHQGKAGFDFARLYVNFASPVPAISIVSSGVSDLLNGVPLGITYSSGEVLYQPIPRYAAFAQDTFKVTDRLHLLLGGRWEFTPSPFQQSGFVYLPTTFEFGYWNGNGVSQLSSTGLVTGFATSSWPTPAFRLSPRFGAAYHLKAPDLVLRAGTGLFYDTQLGSIISNTNPLTIWQFLPNPTAPNLPRTGLFAGAAGLSIPAVWEWKTSVEKSFAEQSVATLTYFGSTGRNLLRNEATVDPQSNALESLAFTSQGRSNYNALLANVRAQLMPNLHALVSYTWSHSIDTGSSDTAPLLADGPSNKGSSSFDVRHVLSASLGYRTPNRFGHILGGWSLSSTSFARSGFPFDVTTVDESIGLGFDNADRANLVLGQPIWISNSAVPGGRSLNPAAFQSAGAGVAGTLGRNALRGFGTFQTDASLRKQVRLYRGSSVEAVVSAFNLLNHPSFSNPINYLGSALFGQSTSMMNLMLGSGSPTTGLTPLYQAGGPRTVELSLRFSF